MIFQIYLTTFKLQLNELSSLKTFKWPLSIRKCTDLTVQSALVQYASIDTTKQCTIILIVRYSYPWTS